MSNKKIARGDTFSFELETKKNLGQNFLTDRSILAQIVSRAQEHALVSERKCIEIGPGSGALTRHLLEAGWTVVAIEKDPRAVEGLKTSLSNEFPGQLEIIEQDILQVNPSNLMTKWNVPPLCIGNIPYYITSDIILWFLSNAKKFSAGIFMVQKEVGERLASSPGHKDYGRLTVRTQLACKVDYVLTAPASAFVPPPKVDSAVIELCPHLSSILNDIELEKFEKFTAMLFSARRKMLRKTIQQAGHELFGLQLNPEKTEILAQKLSSELKIVLTQRPEELAPLQFLNLYRILKEEQK